MTGAKLFSDAQSCGAGWAASKTAGAGWRRVGRRGGVVVALISALLSIGASPSSGEAQSTEARSFYCTDGSVCLDAKSGLAARVLVRPAAQLFPEPTEEAASAAQDLPAFRPWFVFAEEGVGRQGGGQAEGWYRIGRRPDAPMGWVRAADAFPWRSALVVAYSHPGVDEAQRRSPVLMFDSLGALRELISSSDPGAYAQALERAVAKGEVERFRNAGLVSMEPRRFVDFRTGFYILPVLDFVRLPLFDGEARMLKLAAAVPQTKEDQGRGATALTDASYRRNAVAAPTTEGTAAGELIVEIKFVIDMTASMQPQIDAVGRAIKQLTALLDRDRLNAEFRYGLVGYTDIAEQCDGCPFTLTKDFLPDGPGAAEELLAALKTNQSTRAGGGGDWPESAIEGVAAAVNGVWGQNALRFVILIGDASANPFGDVKNETLSIESVRGLADAAQVQILALHARHEPGSTGAEAGEAPPSAQGAAETASPPISDAALAERQYAELSRNPGQPSAAFMQIEIDPESPRMARQRFYDAVYSLAQQLAERLDKVRTGRLKARAQAASAHEAAAAKVETVAQNAFDAALISYLGAPAKRPRDLTVWALDVDPVDFATQSLEVRVLLEKRELETLILQLEGLLEAFLRAKSLDGRGFFERLQATSASTALDESSAASTARAQRLPQWLAALPYRSQVMGLTPRRFAEMSADARDRLEQSIQRKLYAYRDLYSSDEWIALWPGADEFDMVYPLPLSDLP